MAAEQAHRLASPAEARWASLPVERSPQGLSIGGASVVEWWEQPAQILLGRSVARSGSTVLEIGYGLGMASQEIARQNPSSHTIVEAHPEIVDAAQKAGICASVLLGFWQRVVPTLRSKSFDGIAFDAYPTDGTSFGGSAAETWQQVLPIFPEARRLLTVGGRLAFIDYSNAVARLTEFRDFAGSAKIVYDLFTTPVAIPAACSFAHGELATVVVLRPTP